MPRTADIGSLRRGDLVARRKKKPDDNRARYLLTGQLCGREECDGRVSRGLPPPSATYSLALSDPAELFYKASSAVALLERRWLPYALQSMCV